MYGPWRGEHKSQSFRLSGGQDFMEDMEDLFWAERSCSHEPLDSCGLDGGKESGEDQEDHAAELPCSRSSVPVAPH